MPTDYERTLQALLYSLTNEQICAILSSSDFKSANAMMLDCMIERMKNTGDLLGLCDQLEQIMATSSDWTTLTTVITELKSGKGSVIVQNGVQFKAHLNQFNL